MEGFLPCPRFEDGEVVKLGDKVDGLEYEVVGYDVAHNGWWTIYDRYDQIEGDGFVKRPETHDTLEKVIKDAQKTYNDYWGCCGNQCDDCPAMENGLTPAKRYAVDTCHSAKVIDLVCRRLMLKLQEWQN